jgi:hypothetical protein
VGEIGCLEGALEDGDCVILCCYIGESFWTADGWVWLAL